MVVSAEIKIAPVPVDLVCADDLGEHPMPYLVVFKQRFQIATLVVVVPRQPFDPWIPLEHAHRDLCSKLVHCPRLAPGNRPHMGLGDADNPIRYRATFAPIHSLCYPRFAVNEPRG